MDRLTEAWIMWGKAAVEMYDIIFTLHKQIQVLDDPAMMKQVVEMAFAAANERADVESVNKMKEFISENILIEERKDIE